MYVSYVLMQTFTDGGVKTELTVASAIGRGLDTHKRTASVAALTSDLMQQLTFTFCREAGVEILPL